MKSKSFNQFVRMMEKEDCSLIQISAYKKDFPEEYETYNEAYKKARNECMKAHSAGIEGYKGFDYMSVENILKQAKCDKSVPYPDMPYSEATKKAAEVEARNARIQSGNATHSDYVSITNELYGKGR